MMKLRLVSIVLIAGILVVGCNLPQQNPATPDPDQVATQVQQLLTQIPTTLPPTSPPTVVPPTPTATQEITPTSTAEPSETPTTIAATSTQPPTDPRLILGDPTWIDDLDNGNNFAVYTDDHVKIEEKDGYLAMTAFNPDGWHSWTLSFSNLVNFYLEATIKPEECSGNDRYGVVFRAPENNKGYVYGFSCDGQYSMRNWDGKTFTAIVDWTANEAIRKGPNQANRVGIMVKGNQFTFYANGVQTGQVQDNTYTQGKFGLFIAASETEDFTAQYDEIAYWNLP